MSDTMISAWVAVLLFVVLNGFAGGVAAVLHARRSTMRRRGKVAFGSLAGGLVTGAMVVPFAINDLAIDASEGPVIAVLAMAAIVLIAAVLSLPGALIVVRQLDRPADVHAAFE